MIKIDIHSAEVEDFVEDTTPSALHKICELINALQELRELAMSGSEEMAIIDEALKKFGVTAPWLVVKTEEKK